MGGELGDFWKSLQAGDCEASCPVIPDACGARGPEARGGWRGGCDSWVPALRPLGFGGNDDGRDLVLGSPGVAHVAGEMAGGDQDDVEAPEMGLQLVAAGDPDAGGLFDAAAKLRRDGFER